MPLNGVESGDDDSKGPGDMCWQGLRLGVHGAVQRIRMSLDVVER